MNYFISALQFLTILKIKNNIEEKYLPSSLIFFPLVGLIIGFLASILNLSLSYLFTSLFSDTLTIFFIIFFTGGIHIDGVADTFDGIFGGKNKEEILKIMRDKNIGTFGVISVIFVILLKIFLLNSLDKTLKFKSFLLFPLISRWAIVFSIYFFPYGRESGKGEIFFKNINLKIFSLSTILTFGLIFFIDYNFISLFLFSIVFTFLLCKFFIKKIDGLTGDTLGAINEFNEVIELLLINLLK